MEVVEGTPDGLRERKKAATRLALHEAALRLAVEHGYEHVTVEAIADAANVSRRTFSNHFSTKEEAFVHGDRLRMRRLLELVRERPAAEPPWRALRAAAVQHAAERTDIDPVEVARRRPVRKHPALLPHQLAAYAVVERELAEEIARRLPLGPDVPLRARSLAAVFLTAVRVAVEQWVDRPSGPLAEQLGHSLSELADDIG